MQWYNQRCSQCGGVKGGLCVNNTLPSSTYDSRVYSCAQPLANCICTKPSDCATIGPDPSPPPPSLLSLASSSAPAPAPLPATSALGKEPDADVGGRKLAQTSEPVLCGGFILEACTPPSPPSPPPPFPPPGAGGQQGPNGYSGAEDSTTQVCRFPKYCPFNSFSQCATSFNLAFEGSDIHDRVSSQVPPY